MNGFPHPDADRMRSMLLTVVSVGMLGSGAELLLLGHFEDTFQWVPLVALGLGLGSALLITVTQGRGPVAFFRVVMLGFVATGCLGVIQHYRGNVEFEKEMYPSRGGFELFREAMSGATPALAPGVMVLLGLVGLTYCLRHSRLQG